MRETLGSLVQVVTSQAAAIKGLDETVQVRAAA